MSKLKTKTPAKLTANMLPKECCARCFYWLYGSLRSSCRRYPPTALPYQISLEEGWFEVETFAAQPETSYRDWCGEFEPVENLESRLDLLSTPRILNSVKLWRDAT